MEPVKSWKSVLGVVAAAAVAVALVAGGAEAFGDSEAGECVRSCMDAAKACEAPVREATTACLEEAGCPALRDAAKAACATDPEGDDCEAAVAAVKECVAPCKETQKTELSACRAAALACLRDECGLEGLPLRCGRASR